MKDKLADKLTNFTLLAIVGASIFLIFDESFKSGLIFIGISLVIFFILIFLAMPVTKWMDKYYYPGSAKYDLQNLLMNGEPPKYYSIITRTMAFIRIIAIGIFFVLYAF